MEKRDPKPIRLCVGASAGGHMNQLLKLLEHTRLWPVQPAFYLTTLDELAGKLSERGPVYVLGECNRHHPFKALRTLYRSFRIVLRERPDAVVTTGSMPLMLFCLFAKLFRAKVVWIDSIANIEKLSVSGRCARCFADLILSQWPQVAKKYKRVEYVGTLL
jgi:UDP-N-acetylglucosamine:LPS N-acetylglucosamine transferase